MTLIDPNKVIYDPLTPNLFITAEADLSAANSGVGVTPVTKAWPTQEGKYVIFQATPPENDIWIITSITCFAFTRTSVDTTSEGREQISAKNGNNAFLFEPRAGASGALGSVYVSLPAWTKAVGATSNDVNHPSGITLISDEPFDNMSRSAGNGTMRLVVPPGSPFTMLFSLLPQAVTVANRLNARFAIGGQTPLADDALSRIDWAAFTAVGYQTSRDNYDTLKALLEKRSK